MLKSDIKSCPSATDPFFQARCATAHVWHKFWMVITQWAHMPLAFAIHHLNGHHLNVHMGCIFPTPDIESYLLKESLLNGVLLQMFSTNRKTSINYGNNVLISLKFLSNPFVIFTNSFPGLSFYFVELPPSLCNKFFWILLNTFST